MLAGPERPVAATPRLRAAVRRPLRRTPWRWRSACARLLTIAALAGGPPAALGATSPGASANAEPQTRPLAARHQHFLEQTRLLASETEHQVFLELSEDYRRDAFVRQFWRVRDPHPETARNEFREAWEDSHELARQRYPDAEDGRHQLMAVHGEPRRTLRISCELLRPLELWHYGARPKVAELWAVLMRQGGRYRLWSPSQGLFALAAGRLPLDANEAAEAVASACSRGDEILTALALSPDWDSVGLTDHLRPGDDEWALALRSRSLETEEGADTTTLEPRIEYIGRHQSRTVVKARLAIPRSSIQLDDRATGGGVARLLLDGEVVRGDDLFETFRYRFDLPLGEGVEDGGDGGGGAPDDIVPVAIERLLRPGRYRLRLRVADRLGDHAFIADQELDVPRWRRPEPKDGGVADRPVAVAGIRGAEEPGPLAPDIPGSESDPAADEPSVRLSVPRDELLTGRVRVEAFSSGPGIARVGFDLDGRRLLTKASPPYSVEIDIGRAPRRRELRAYALDEAGAELAEDSIVLNAGPNSFSIRLVEPRRGSAPRGSVRAVAEVDVPPLEKLDRVEFFLNEERLATLYQPPFVQPLEVPGDLDLSFVRAVAVLDGGGFAEDMVFLNAPDEVEYLDVDFVQLYVSASDRRGRPVTDLAPEEISVREDGQAVTLRRIEPVRDLPIHACVLLDTSISMQDRLREASSAALYFFERVLSERDRACLVTFSDHHDLAVGFTSSMEVLSGGVSGLVAEGETALYDSLIHTLYYFGGIRGKRALVLLSDGDDSTSEYDFEEALEFARRSGVAIYTIGLAIDNRQMDVRARLNRLARETGGESYFIHEATELRRLYTEIEEELRSQYLLAYQSPGQGEGYREIEVEVARKGVKARTLRGYYP
ncbi:MAG: VWA domain-containing protein [Acidobacteria bacterium]|nr:MAG: VWA domain-containing protein [Acidobacteriota bacterium]